MQTQKSQLEALNKELADLQLAEAATRKRIADAQAEAKKAYISENGGRTLIVLSHLAASQGIKDIALPYNRGPIGGFAPSIKGNFH